MASPGCCFFRLARFGRRDRPQSQKSLALPGWVPPGWGPSPRSGVPPRPGAPCLPKPWRRTPPPSPQVPPRLRPSFFSARAGRNPSKREKKNVFWKAVPTLCQVPVVVRRVKPVHFLKATILFCPGVVFWSDFRSAQGTSTVGSDLALMAYRLCYLNETGQQNHLRWHKVGLVLRHRKSPERAPTAAHLPPSRAAQGPKLGGSRKKTNQFCVVPNSWKPPQ